MKRAMAAATLDDGLNYDLLYFTQIVAVEFTYIELF